MAQDGAPLSAIDWLSRSVTAPPLTPADPPLPDEPPVTDSAAAPEVTTTPLDAPSPDRVGLLPTNVTGLPQSLWAASDVDTLVALIADRPLASVPAVQDLMITLILAKADPPGGAGPGGEMLLARVDRLLNHGALAPAQALIEAADTETPAIFARLFDISLLTGTEDAACELLRAQADLAPTYPARVFCLARNGDWRGAALTLNTARALGDISDEEDELLSRFLDPALSEEAEPLAPPSRPSPLVFLIREAIGEGLPTAGLPLAFAHADLRSTASWRSQIEAAERLVRDGLLPAAELFAAYTRQKPAASGGVWDRAAAVQDFDAALQSGEASDIADTLPEAFDAFAQIRAEVAFATLFAEDLLALPLPENQAVADLVVRVGLLSPLYETVATSADLADAVDPFLSAIARGETPADGLAMTSRDRAVADAFAGADPPERFETLLAEDKLGETILRAIALFNAGLSDDPSLVRDALATFRAVGLETTARRAALQYLLLERDG